MPCWGCGGRYETCSTCCKAGDPTRRARGRVWFDRCPSALMEPWVVEFVHSLYEFDRGHFPAPGGVNDQAAAWLAGARLLMPHLHTARNTAADRESKRRG